jgi:hypothetical protein
MLILRKKIRSIVIAFEKNVKLVPKLRRGVCYLVLQNEHFNG